MDTVSDSFFYISRVWPINLGYILNDNHRLHLFWRESNLASGAPSRSDDGIFVPYKLYHVIFLKISVGQRNDLNLDAKVKSKFENQPLSTIRSNFQRSK